MIRFFSLSILFLLGFTSFASAPNKKRTPSSYERPPQFVLLAFDGSSNLDMWKESLDFAETVNTTGLNDEQTKIKFTYFINPTYYTETKYMSNYQTPRLGYAYSCIGWAAPEGSVLERLQYTNRAYLHGHEIGSHANCHCSADGKGDDKLRGRPWAEADWTSEFDQFNYLLFNAVALNHINAPSDFAMSFKKEDIIGFRSPFLATTPGLWPTLKKFNFKYDTSASGKPDYWPERKPWGGWNYPLGEIKATWRSKPIQSMDFTWLANQSGGESLPTKEKCDSLKHGKNKWCDKGIYLSPDRINQIYNQMLESYNYYFKKNYFGNRAPVQIGHHFSKWNGGAYWEAMKAFAKNVCSRPEVKCVTMKEYTQWLDGLSSSEYQAYRSGQFPRLPDDYTIKDISSEVMIPVSLNTQNGKFSVATDSKTEAKIKMLGLKKQLSIDFAPIKEESISQADLIKYATKGAAALVRASLVNKQGQEVSWQTFKIKNVGPAQEIPKQSVEDMADQSFDPAEAHLVEE